MSCTSGSPSTCTEAQTVTGKGGTSARSKVLFCGSLGLEHSLAGGPPASMMRRRIGWHIRQTTPVNGAISFLCFATASGYCTASTVTLNGLHSHRDRCRICGSKAASLGKEALSILSLMASLPMASRPQSSAATSRRAGPKAGE
jgi:hypothetical protein